MRAIIVIVMLAVTTTLSLAEEKTAGNNLTNDPEQSDVLIEPSKSSRWELLLGLKATTPQRVSISLGAARLFPRGETWQKNSHGPLIQIEPGWSGCKYQIGYMIFWAESGIGGATLFKLSLLQTWDDPIGIEKDQIYLGGEFEVMGMYILNLNIGAYGHISGDVDDDNFLLSAGIGIGY